MERTLLPSEVMTTLHIQAKRPPASTLRTPRRTVGVEAGAEYQGGIDGSFAPAFEVREYADHFEFQVDVPGVRAKELAVFISEGWVTVMGGRKPKADSPDCSGYRAYERGFGAFWRAFQLSPNVTSTGAQADLGDGVLTLLVPKGESN
jgi:HSP20 family protein